MNEAHFIDGVICENISGSGEILTTQPGGKIVNSTLKSTSLSDYDLFYNSVSFDWDNNSDQTMVLDTQTRVHPNYSTDGTGISVTEADEYIIQADVSIFSIGGGRSNTISWLAINGIEVAGTRGYCYLRQLDHGATCSLCAIVDLLPTDVLTIVTNRNAGSGDPSQIANGTRLFIRRGV